MVLMQLLILEYWLTGGFSEPILDNSQVSDGAPAYTATVGHGASYGGHGSGESNPMGKETLPH